MVQRKYQPTSVAEPRPRAVFSGARGHGRQRDQIQAIVLEHGLQRPRIARAHESEEPTGNLEAWNISHPGHVEQQPLQRREAAAGVIAAMGFIERARPEWRAYPNGGI